MKEYLQKEDKKSAKIFLELLLNDLQMFVLKIMKLLKLIDINLEENGNTGFGLMQSLEN
jgi:hypothetical protein